MKSWTEFSKKENEALNYWKLVIKDIKNYETVCSKIGKKIKNISGNDFYTSLTKQYISKKKLSDKQVFWLAVCLTA